MSTVSKELNIQEQALLDAGAWAQKVEQVDPVVAVDYLRGTINGLIHALGQMDGHRKTRDFVLRCALQQRRLQQYDDAARAAFYSRREVQAGLAAVERGLKQLGHAPAALPAPPPDPKVVLFSSRRKLSGNNKS